MVEIEQGEIWWAGLPEPAGSAAGFERPVVIVQGNALNRSRIATALCVPLTSNLRWAEAPGNVELDAKSSGLPKDSVTLTPLMLALDRRALIRRVSKLPPKRLAQILSGIDIVLGR